ncbi:hypothetical protein A2U01_0080294, partial [Trifolium medium]|nr:hypothetical protein [Trifolium medium]
MTAISCMQDKDLLPGRFIRKANKNFSIKTTRPSQSRVNSIEPICGSNYKNITS